MSLICLIDMQAKSAYILDAKQTLDNDEGTRIDTYGNQVIQIERDGCGPAESGKSVVQTIGRQFRRN
jgi:hypothetical protein